MLSNLIANLNTVNDTSSSESYISGIADKGRNLVEKFTGSNIGNFFGAANIFSKFVDTKTKNEKNTTKIKSSNNQKNPHFTTLGQGPILPLRRGDSESDILAKMYRFMVKVRDEEKKEYQLFKDFEEERKEEEERRHERLVDAIIKSRTGKKEEKKDPLTGFLQKIMDFLKKVSGTIFKIVTSLPKMIMRFMRSNFFGSFLGRRGGSMGRIARGAVGALALGSAFRYVTGEQQQEQTKASQDLSARQQGPSDRIKEEGPYNTETETAIKDGAMKEYKYTSLESGNEVTVPLTNDEASKLIQDYNSLKDNNLSTEDKDNLKKDIRDITIKGLKRHKTPDDSEISLLENPTASTAVRVARKAGANIVEGVQEIIDLAEGPLRYLGLDPTALQQQLDNVLRYMRPEGEEDPARMENQEERDIVRDYMRMLGLDSDTPSEQTTVPPAIPPATPEQTPPSSSPTETDPPLPDIPPGTISPEMHIGAGFVEGIKKIWNERENITGIRTTEKSKEDLIVKMQQEQLRTGRSDILINFKKLLEKELNKSKGIKTSTPVTTPPMMEEEEEEEDKLELVQKEPKTNKYEIPKMISEDEVPNNNSTPTVLNNTQNNNIGGKSKFMDTNSTIARNDNQSILDTLMRTIVPV